MPGAGDRQLVTLGNDHHIRVACVGTKGQRFKNAAGHARLYHEINLIGRQAGAHRKSGRNVKTCRARSLQCGGIIAIAAPFDHPHGLGNCNTITNIPAQTQFCDSAWRLDTGDRHDADLAIIQRNVVDCALGQNDLGLVVGNGHPAIDAGDWRHPAAKCHLDILHGDAAFHRRNLQFVLAAFADNSQPYIIHPARQHFTVNPVARLGDSPVRPDTVKGAYIHIAGR